MRGVTQLLCLLLGLGGLQRDRKQGTLGTTLALPVSPSQVDCNAGRGGYGGSSRAVAAPGGAPVGGVAAGGGAVFSGAVAAVCAAVDCGGMLTFAISFLSSVIFQSEYTALAVAYVAYLFYLAGTHHPKLRAYPLNVGDLMNGWLGHFLNPHALGWSGTMPMAILCGFAAAALCLFVTAGWIMSRQDL